MVDINILLTQPWRGDFIKVVVVLLPPLLLNLKNNVYKLY